MTNRRGRRTLFERDQYRLGITGTVVAVALMLGALQVTRLPLVAGGREYVAELTEAGGLSPGDDVRVAGLVVGTVESVRIEGTHVAVKVNVRDSDLRVGTASTARVVTVNVLGKKAVEIEPKGSGELKPGARFRQSLAPYDITQALNGLTGELQPLDVEKVSAALNSISDTFAETPPEVTRALDGLSAVAKTISARDEALTRLLDGANDVTGVLASRNQQISSLLNHGNELLAELNARRLVITGLLQNATNVARQLSGLVKDQHASLAPALAQVRKTIDLLNRNKVNLTKAIAGLGTYATELGDAVGSGPFFSAYVPNISNPVTLPFFPKMIDEILSGKGNTP